ncbi:Protein kinase, ATP binding site-containing protein [Artemisia annua]|uniref:Protein kinase, ATP binding site-containing protein n=1 Tax=Artemisia annua TaxID=35608 RepID=A0A2U1QHX2_ARTAN|nr:Protein kinase, ATP binding site-containing protein [Artemisia annua]
MKVKASKGLEAAKEAMGKKYDDAAVEGLQLFLERTTICCCNKSAEVSLSFFLKWLLKGWVDEHSLAASKLGTGIVIAIKRLNQEGFQQTSSACAHNTDGLRWPPQLIHNGRDQENWIFFSGESIRESSHMSTKSFTPTRAAIAITDEKMDIS